MSKLGSGRCGWWALGALALALSFSACDLNPQPEVPGASGSAGMGGGFGGTSAGGGGGLGGMAGGLGVGGTNGEAGAGKCSGGCGEGQLCNSGDCVDDPCAPNSCSAEKACKPNADYTAATCVTSCADITCAPGETCTDGKCQATGCASPCATGEVCAPDGDGGYACVPDQCAGDAGNPCGLGESCAPATGACQPDPCNGVKCPAEQTCLAGQCLWAGDAAVGDASPTDAGALDASSD